MINTLGTHPISQWILVAVHSDCGHTGIGEACGSPTWSGEYYLATLEMLRDILAPVILARDPRDLPAIAGDMDRALQHNPFAKAAFEMAILDLMGKAQNLPVYALLGGKARSTSIPLKFSIGAYPPAQAARVAESLVAQRFQAVKVKVGRSLSADLDRVLAVRSAVGDKCRISVDANGGWTESDLLAARAVLEKAGVNAIEEPLRRGDIRRTARMRERTSIPIILDESIFTPEQALEAIRWNACDLISIYPGKNGGIRRSLEIASIAAAAGIDCIIGSNIEGSVGSAAMLQLAASLPNLSPSIGHEIIGPLYHTHVLDPLMPTIRDGHADLPGGIGLGANINLESLQKHGRLTARN
jgi:L-alanine-DL-glutamate epimerase-like enolase superfamily enzyme